MRISDWSSDVCSSDLTPTFSELAYRPDGAGGLNDLGAARSRNMEVGVRARTAALAYSAALFDSRTRDEVVVVANEGGRSVYDNAGTTRRRGAEFSVSEIGRAHV